MDDFLAALKARNFVAKTTPVAIPVDVELYVRALQATHIVDTALPSNVAGFSTEISGQPVICTNGNDTPQRQRFTVCHEIAHLVLQIPTQHDDTGSPPGFMRRHPNEVCCDVFAAELLLPYRLFRARAKAYPTDFSAVEALAVVFEASLAATGSRYATDTSDPCAFVLSEAGHVRYASISKPLREAGARIPRGTAVPKASFASARSEEAAAAVPADRWFADWRHGGYLSEETRYFPRWQQSLTLLVLETDGVSEEALFEEANDAMLQALDGRLPWPSKR